MPRLLNSRTLIFTLAITGWFLFFVVLVLLYKAAGEHERVAATEESEDSSMESENMDETPVIELRRAEADAPVMIAEPLAEASKETSETEATTTDSDIETAEIVEDEQESEPAAPADEELDAESQSELETVEEDQKPDAEDTEENEVTTLESSTETAVATEPEPTTGSLIDIDSSLSYTEKIVAVVHARTNIERVAAGVPPLAFDEDLADLAEDHSQDMYDRNFFSHTNPDGCNLACRLTDVSYSARAWGENIAWRESSRLPAAEQVAEGFMEGWLESPGHRENILREGYTHEGVGAVRIGNFVFITTVFADPR